MDNTKLLKKWLQNTENRKVLQKLLHQSLFEAAQLVDEIKQEQKAIWETLNRDMGEAIRAKRFRSGLSLRQVATKLSCSAAYLCDCEYGRRKLSLVRLYKYEQIVKRIGKLRRSNYD